MDKEINRIIDGEFAKMPDVAPRKDGKDVLLVEAVKLVKKYGKVSVEFLQKELMIGQARAQLIIRQL